MVFMGSFNFQYGIYVDTTWAFKYNLHVLHKQAFLSYKISFKKISYYDIAIMIL